MSDVTRSDGPPLTVDALLAAMASLQRLPWRDVEAELVKSDYVEGRAVYVVDGRMVVTSQATIDWLRAQAGPLPPGDREFAQMCVYHARLRRDDKRRA